MRTPLNLTTVSTVTPTPVTLAAMDTTTLATTLSGSIDVLTQNVPVSAYTGIGMYDFLRLGATEIVQVIGNALDIYTVTIGSTGTPDQFTWNKVTGSIQGPVTSGVSITGAAQSLGDGVTITFAATTGHTLGDQWVITVTAGVIGAVVFTGSGLNDATSAGTFTAPLICLRGANGTAALPQSSGAAVISLSVGNSVPNAGINSLLLFFNSDSSPHNVVIYSQQGSITYILPAGAYFSIGRQLGALLQLDGSIWLNASSALVFCAPQKIS